MIGRKRTMVVVGERIEGGGFRTVQSAYGSHLLGLGRALDRVGVRSFSQEDIRRQIAQAEIDAYFNNDPDAALAASKKHGADLVLRGTISSRSSYNELMGLPEVAVSMALALANGSGRVLAHETARADSYSGSDTLRMAVVLVDEQAPALVARLFRDYCRAASL